MKTQIKNKTGNGVRGLVEFEATSPTPISKDEALTAQAKMGYPPAGYGFSKFTVIQCPVLLTYKATWECQASCD